MKLVARIISLFLLASTLLLFTACKPSGDDPPSGGGADGGVFEPDSVLVEAIIKLIGYGESDRAMLKVGTAARAVELGSIPLHLDFEHSESYFVAAYYNDSYELRSMSWVGFENANNILEYYENRKVGLVFQIYVTSLSHNLLTGEATNKAVFLFRDYVPCFVDGVNVKESDSYNGHGVYPVGDSHVGEIYFYTVSDAGDMYMTLEEFNYHSLDCVTVDGAHCLKIICSTSYSGGDVYEYDLISELGAYYDDFIDLMITGEYSETASDGTVYDYGLIPLEDFVRIVKENAEGV